MQCMKKNLFNCLHFYGIDFLWKSLCTTNILERAFREVRRRPSVHEQLFNQCGQFWSYLVWLWRGKTLKQIYTI